MRTPSPVALLAMALAWCHMADLAQADPVAPAAVAIERAPAKSAELAAFKRAIRTKYDLKEQAFAAQDADTIVDQFYTEDVVSVGEGEGVFIGREQIRPLYRDVVQRANVKIESISSFVKGDAGWDWADFHVLPRNPKEPPFTFAILFLWTRVHGEWFCKGDFFAYGSLRNHQLTSPPKAAD
jgi:ketosteroid isomerase-like protein